MFPGPGQLPALRFLCSANSPGQRKKPTAESGPNLLWYKNLAWGQNLFEYLAKDVSLLLAKILPIITAAVAGITMAVQGTLNSLLSKATGLLETTFWVQLTGAVVSALLLFVFRLGDGDLLALGKAPWYSLLGGALGVLITFFVASSISKVGATAATTAIIVGQVTTAGLLDHFGVLGLKSCPFVWSDALGIVLLAIGAKLLLH